MLTNGKVCSVLVGLRTRTTNMPQLSVNPRPTILNIFPPSKTGQLRSAKFLRGLCGDWLNVMHVPEMLQKSGKIREVQHLSRFPRHCFAG